MNESNYLTVTVEKPLLGLYDHLFGTSLARGQVSKSFE